jgi:hypothetical protein
MTPIRDFDGSYVIKGYEHIKFSSEADAKAGLELAKRVASNDAFSEIRYRRAAERAQQQGAFL